MSVTTAARALAPTIAARAAEGEALRTMPPDLVAALKRAGLFRIAVPRTLGGLELAPTEIIEVIEQISRADGSAGWTVLIGNAAAFFSWLEPDVVTAMFGGPPDIISTGTFSPTGRAVPTGDGHLVLDGRWGFNSGCCHADWYQLGFLVMAGDVPARRPDGRPDWRFAYIPSHDAEVVDTWRVAGLRGTGSHDVVVADLRLPEAHTAMPMFDPPRHTGPLLEVGFRALTATLLVGFPLGVARRALDELAARAPAKRRWSRESTVAEDALAQRLAGAAEAGLQSARAFAFDAFGAAWEAIGRDGTTTVEQRSRMLLATQQAMEAALGAVEVAYRLVGAAAVYEDDPIGRCFRDVQTARQHVIFSGELFAEYGRARFGVPEPAGSRGALAPAPAPARRPERWPLAGAAMLEPAAG
jgi:alkylation response protein AidB-like acyl-CoA dehydrogenase